MNLSNVIILVLGKLVLMKVKFKDRLSLMQYNPMKPIKRGYKIWSLADQRRYWHVSFQNLSRKRKNCKP